MAKRVQLQDLETNESIYPMVDIDSVSGLNTRLVDIESKEDKDTIYDDTELKQDLKTLRERVNSLEAGSGTGDGSYNDSELRGRIVVLEDAINNLQPYDDTELLEKMSDIEQSLDSLSQLKTSIIAHLESHTVTDEELQRWLDNQFKQKEDKLPSGQPGQVLAKTSTGYEFIDLPRGGGDGSTGGGDYYDDTALKQWISDNYIKKGEIDLSGYASRVWVESQGFLTSHQDLSEYIKSSEVEGKLTSLKSEILGGVGEDYDTLKEIESWITSHQDLYDGLITTISSKATKDEIADMATQTWVTSKLSEIKPYDDTKIKQDIANLKIDKADAVWVIENFQPIGNYPTKEEVTQQILEIVTDGQVSLDGYATETYVENKLKDITSKLNVMSEKLDVLPYVNVIPDEETYNQMEKEDNNVYLIEGDPSKFTTQDDLDILQNSIETNVNEKMEDYQLKSNMTDFIKAYDFAQLVMRVEELEKKLKEQSQESEVSND